MSEIVRFSVSLEGELLEKFDSFCRQQQIATRSEAVRQLIRQLLTEQAWESGSRQVVGTLTLVYDHHRAQLRDRLMEMQHDNTDLVVSTLHTHLNHDVCMEVIVLRGPADRLRAVSDRLRGLKGIFKGDLVMAAAQEG